MCGENDDPVIPVYRFDNDGMGGPTQDTIEGVLDDIRGELENWTIEDTPITLTITTGKMKRSGIRQATGVRGLLIRRVQMEAHNQHHE